MPDPADLDQEHIDAAAKFAAGRLATDGVARVRLAPGDMTEYRFVIASPGTEWAYGGERPGKYYWVTLCADFGCGYEWHGGAVDGGYAAEKYTNPSLSKATRAWTGEVVARFLTAVSAATELAVDEVTRAHDETRLPHARWIAAHPAEALSVLEGQGVVAKQWMRPVTPHLDPTRRTWVLHERDPGGPWNATEVWVRIDTLPPLIGEEGAGDE